MQIIRAIPAEAPLLTEMAHCSKRYWGYPEAWIQTWRDVLTVHPDIVETDIAFIARLENQPAGFYVLTLNHSQPCLEHLWVLPQFMKRGVGRALFQHAIAQMRDQGQRSMRIESDPNAEGFYLRMGAQRIGTNVTILLGEPRETPILEWRA
jgi:GNAT superfamily N-acetyltransferase